MLERNIHTYTITEQLNLHKAKAVILGCGGGGCSISEVLARTGVGNITIVDFDTFEDSNLNRQLGATIETMGKYKVDVIGDRIKTINPRCTVTAYKCKIDETNYKEILKDKDIILDAVDGVRNKLNLCNYVKDIGKVYTTGGLGGYHFWCATLKEKHISDILGTDENAPGIYPCASSVFAQAAIEAQQGINYYLNRNIDKFIDKIIDCNMLGLTMNLSEIDS